MSIVVYLTYTGQNGAAARFAREMLQSGTVAAIRAEEGNEGYDYFLPLEHPEELLLIDRWSSQEALDRHHASPMMQTIAALREKYDLHTRAERFRLEGDELPQGDQAFLRK